MSTQGIAMHKITISLPGELADFADRRAGQMNSSRSQIISGALAETKAREEAMLAAEGYQYDAHEAEAFAASLPHYPTLSHIFVWDSVGYANRAATH